MKQKSRLFTLLTGFVTAAVPLCASLAAAEFLPGKVCTVYAAAEEVLKMSVSEDSAAVVSCAQTAEGIIEIPAEYRGLPITEISPRAFYNCKNITAVVVPDSVTTVGEGAFADAEMLESVRLPYKMQAVPDSCFSGCTALKAVLVPPDVKTIGEGAFESCGQLEEISIPDYVQSIGRNAFWQCSSLNAIDIPDRLETIEAYAFGRCESLISVTIPEGVRRIKAAAFAGCSRLASVSIPESMERIGENAFAGCNSLVNVKLPAAVTELGSDAFADCKLRSMTVLNPQLSLTEAFKSMQAREIVGYPGSTAEAFTKETGIAFTALELPATTAISTTNTAIPTTTRKTTTTRNYVTTGTGTTRKNRIQKSLVKYDINGNGTFNIADAVLLVRYISEEGSVTIPDSVNPDVNRDGLLTLADAAEVLRGLRPFSIVVGKTTAKPGETVSVPVLIYGDKGTAGGAVYIGFDSKLTPVSVHGGDAYSAAVTCDGGYYPLYLGWTTNNGLEETAENGAILANLEFTVDPNITQTEYLEISVLNSSEFTDSEGYTYSANYGTGYITVIP